MACESFKMRDGTRVHVHFRGPARKPPKCSVRGCMQKAEYACDFVIPKTVNLALFAAYQNSETAAATCDKPLCTAHARQIGPDLHHCPSHPSPLGAP